ncbi:carbon storage regulator CsrA [Paenibacillus alkalitolerans]|uniref:carbon storage regulator CsrA n=1 Tax=Paenibacillus alkalitolerans TaxID=2799335 RepID=UPI0018F61FAB|nr:carbon storage regulator CsrA [Paenibacillus alkalitolerans]
MLVLTRKKGESITIGDHIEVVVLGIEGDTVKIGIQAPKEVEIFRKEVYLSIKESNQEASKTEIGIDELRVLAINSKKIKEK